MVKISNFRLIFNLIPYEFSKEHVDLFPIKDMLSRIVYFGFQLKYFEF